MLFHVYSNHLVQPFVQTPLCVLVHSRFVFMDRLPTVTVDIISDYLSMDELCNLMAANTTTAHFNNDEVGYLVAANSSAVSGHHVIVRVVLLRRRHARMRFRSRLLLNRSRRIDLLVARFA